MTLGKWALLPAADDVLEGLMEMGRADALRWAERNGWTETVREEGAAGVDRSDVAARV